MDVQIPDQRVLQGAAATLRWTNLDGDGNPVVAAGTVTATLTRASGTVIASGRATSAGDEAGDYTCTLSASEAATLDTITVTWTDGGDSSTHTTTVEVAGGFLFSLRQARNFHTSLADEGKLSDVDLVAARLAVEWECEQICGRAFVPRARRVTLTGDGTRRLHLPDPEIRTVVSASIDGTALTAGELAELTIGDDWVDRPAGDVWDWDEDIVIAYTHGWPAPPPELRDASMLRLRAAVNAPTSGIPLRARSFTDANGVGYELNRATSRRTGIDEVDGVYLRYSRNADGDGDGDTSRPYSRALDFDPQHGSLFHGGRT